MTRPLTTCEKTGTIIKHKKVKTVAKIIGTIPKAFVIEVLQSEYGNAEKEAFLPFKNIKFYVVEDE